MDIHQKMKLAELRQRLSERISDMGYTINFKHIGKDCSGEDMFEQTVTVNSDATYPPNITTGTLMDCTAELLKGLIIMISEGSCEDCKHKDECRGLSSDGIKVVRLYGGISLN